MQTIAERDNRAIVELNASLRDGEIVAEIAHEGIRQLVFAGQIVVLKGVFAAEEMTAYRKALMRWASETAAFPHGTSPGTFPDLNFHRRDDGVIKSICPHIFHQFGFNSIEKLEESVGTPSLAIAESLRGLQNGVAGTDFPLSLTSLRLKVLHYPSGAGFLTEHSHPIEPQRIGLIASLSRIGADVTSGATRFRTPFGLVDTSTAHDIGDVIIFRYDLPHEVTLVDEGRLLDWNSDAGKWSVVLELRETHALSHSRSQV